jgi:hypothetical protein
LCKPLCSQSKIMIPWHITGLMRLHIIQMCSLGQVTGNNWVIMQVQLVTVKTTVQPVR